MKAEQAIEEVKSRIICADYVDSEYIDPEDDIESINFAGFIDDLTAGFVTLDIGIEAMIACMNALGKQIPKKPIIKQNKYTDVVQQYYCPNCGRYFGQAGIHNVILFNKEKYCQGEGCGQAIDWDMEHME